MLRIFRQARPASAALLLVLASGSLAAQEPVPPAQPPAEPAPTAPTVAETSEPVAEPVAEPATGPGAAESPATVAPAPAVRAKVVLLPVEFSVFEKGVGSGELVADWTEAARANLGEAATGVLGERAGLELVPMPDLDDAEQQALREHLALVKLVVMQANMLPGGVWRERKADFDRQFGDGLRFLREKSGADFAVVIDGAQVKQTGGSVFTQIALASVGVGVGGGGTYLTTSLLDMEAGEIKWFNARAGAEMFGITGSDIRQLEEAKATLRKLFEPYPAIPALSSK